MDPADTSLGGDRRAFPETTWGMLSRLADPSSPRHREGLEALCARYWKPVYRYVRVAWCKSNEDAKDLTQAFFAWLVEGDALQRYRPEKGGFRPYLKVLLKRFVGHQETALHRLKRGGAVRIVPLEGPLAPAEGEYVDRAAESPEAAFDRAWRVEMVNRAVENVRARCAAESRSVAFAVYEGYELVAPAERPTYVQLAARLGLAEGDIKTHLFAVRAEVRAELRSLLMEITGDAGELEGEWRALFGA